MAVEIRPFLQSIKYEMQPLGERGAASLRQLAARYAARDVY